METWWLAPMAKPVQMVAVLKGWLATAGLVHKFSNQMASQKMSCKQQIK